MDDKHIFNKETDSEMLAMDIVTFLQKWGMWQVYRFSQVENAIQTIMVN